MLDRLRSYLPARWAKQHPIVPVVRISGAIGAATPLRPGVTMAALAPLLARAFDIERAPAVAIIINSPGGSPVQSHLIYRRIRALAEEKQKDVLVFVEDVAASGGYLIALAGDEIVVDPSSIVGSIGVVAATFGFVGLIEKLGIERRVYAAGDKKVTLDPFRPEDPDDIAHVEALQAEMHQTFIDLVRERRGDILETDIDLFNGRFWTGEQAHAYGLVDKLGDLRATLRDRYGEDVKIKLIARELGFLPFRRGSGVSGFIEGGRPDGWADEIVSALEARALWARYGL